MKKLSEFNAVKQALEQVVAESDVNNGTTGLTMLAHFWAQESVYDQKRVDLQTEIARLLLNGKTDGVAELQKQLTALPKPKVVMEWRLLEPIPRIQGTKVISDGDKVFRISMENVKTLYIPEDAVKLDLIDYEETEDVMQDSMGRPAQVVKLRLIKGLIDVAAPVVDRYDKIIRPKRAYVTAISYKSMQVAGELMSRDRLKARRRSGFDQEGGSI